MINSSIQYKLKFILRELNKSYIGFNGHELIDEKKNQKKKIATGRWGCGVFGGDSQLKFIIQWIACSQAEREITFFRLKDKHLSKLEEIVNKLKSLEIGQIFNYLMEFSHLFFRQNKNHKENIFEFILNK